jgi:hypothetical protein
MELESSSPYPFYGCVIRPLETFPRRSEWGRSLSPDCFVSRGSICTWVFLNRRFLRRGVVSTSPNPQAGGAPLVGCPRLLIQFIHSYPPYRRPFLHPQPEDAPCRGDRDPHSWPTHTTLIITLTYVILPKKSEWNKQVANICTSLTFLWCGKRPKCLSNMLLSESHFW